jgi:hypothetical protein
LIVLYTKSRAARVTLVWIMAWSSLTFEINGMQ